MLRHVIISLRTNAHCAEIKCYWSSRFEYITIVRMSGFSETRCIAHTHYSQKAKLKVMHL